VGINASLLLEFKQVSSKKPVRDRHKLLIPAVAAGLLAPDQEDGRALTSSAQPLAFSDKGYDPVSRPPLALSRGRKDRLDVKSVLGGLSLAGAPDFIDDGVP
jgi:hypothetical protein